DGGRELLRVGRAGGGEEQLVGRSRSAQGLPRGFHGHGDGVFVVARRRALALATPQNGALQAGGGDVAAVTNDAGQPKPPRRGRESTPRVRPLLARRRVEAAVGW